jgi:hypothetical protein
VQHTLGNEDIQLPSLRNIFDVRRLEKIIPLHYEVMLMLQVELADSFLF